MKNSFIPEQLQQQFKKIQKNDTVILAIILGLVLFFCYIFDIKNLQNKLAVIEKNNLIITKSIRDLNSALQVGSNLNNTILNLEKKITNNETPFLNTDSFPEILQKLEKIAQKNSVELTAITPNSGKSTLNFGITTTKITIIGPYKNIISFFSSAYKLKMPLILGDFVMQPLNSNDNNNKTILIATLVFYKNITNINSATKIDFKKINSLKNKIFCRNPFALAVDENNEASIFSWQNSEFKFLGFFQEKEKIWAIVSDPTNKIYHVTLGTVIGKNRDKIIKISSDEIVTENSGNNIARNFTN